MTSNPVFYDAPQRPAEPIGVVAKRGAVFTRRWIVDLVLDLSGYVPEEDLGAEKLIEPAVGHGAFLIPIVERLLISCERHGRDIADTAEAIAAFDIDPSAVKAARANVRAVLTGHGVDTSTARRLATAWVREADFLKVADSLPPSRWVLGNPPYVRVEDLDPADLVDYRKRWTAMSGRADLYVGFLQAGLSLLAPEGRLGVICADRWMRNQYGATLRSMIEDDFAVDCCVVLHDVDAFEDQVAAYPAVTVLRAGAQAHALVCDANGDFDQVAATRLTAAYRHGPGPVRSDMSMDLSWTTEWFRGGGSSWPSGTPEQLARLTTLEARLPTLKDAGVHLGVGVATGADGIFLTDRTGDIETDRLVRIVAARETSSGQIDWSGRYLVNPWDDDGNLVTLSDYPGLGAYLRRHKSKLEARHVARRRPDTWWRTIDRVDPTLASTPKLLIPDLKDRIHPVLDSGTYYPAHSLYYLTASGWDLDVLGGLLLSDIATSFIEAYSVRMANNYLRVSAQYLRRVRVPELSVIDAATRTALATAFQRRDVEAANQASAIAYSLRS